MSQLRTSQQEAYCRRACCEGDYVTVLGPLFRRIRTFAVQRCTPDFGPYRVETESLMSWRWLTVCEFRSHHLLRRNGYHLGVCCKRWSHHLLSCNKVIHPYLDFFFVV